MEYDNLHNFILEKKLYIIVCVTYNFNNFHKNTCRDISNYSFHFTYFKTIMAVQKKTEHTEH